MKKFITLFIILFFPKKIKPYFLNFYGFKIHKSARIGLSIILIDYLEMGEGARIGNFNFIKGPFSLEMSKKSVISKSNKIIRANRGITYGNAVLTLKENAIVVANHHFDLTRSIYIGENSIVAGIRSQFWTHGYVHKEVGPKRFRVDGKIKIGNNVYLGSGILVNPGVTIGNSINVGGNSTVAKDLIHPGMYVNQPLRFIEKSYDSIRHSLKKIEEKYLIEEVYEK